jgi:hypothetical protein
MCLFLFAFSQHFLILILLSIIIIAITFCGYLPSTHQGLLGVVNQQSPFSGIPHLVWMGRQDGIITNSMTREMAGIFSDPYIVVSNVGNHAPPSTYDPTFQQVVSWLRQTGLNTPISAPTPIVPSPTKAPATVAPVWKPTISSPIPKPTLAPVQSPTNPTQDKCEDKAGWMYKTKRGKKRRCKHIARNPEKRCGKMGLDGTVAYESCECVCGFMDDDDDMDDEFFSDEKDEDGKDEDKDTGVGGGDEDGKDEDKDTGVGEGDEDEKDEDKDTGVGEGDEDEKDEDKDTGVGEKDEDEKDEDGKDEDKDTGVGEGDEDEKDEDKDTGSWWHFWWW